MKINNNFSVILPIYNREDLYLYFDKVISNIYSNTIKPFEVIIVVDGAVSNKFKKKINILKKKFYYRTIYCLKKIGLSKALNKAIKKSRTNWIIRADGDDFNKKNRFRYLIDELKKGYDLVGSDIAEYNSQGKFLNYKIVPKSHKNINFFLKFRNPFNHMSVGFSKKKFIECGGYPNLYLREDYGLWAKMISMEAKVKNINKILVNATAGNEMIKRRSGFKYVLAEFHLRKFLYNLDINSYLLSWIICITRVILLNTPSILKKIIYKQLRIFN
jgi:glycosyltransferase involved in cell wall biosynthesis